MGTAPCDVPMAFFWVGVLCMVLGIATVAADEPSRDEELGEWLRYALNKTVNTDGDFGTVLCPETMWVDGSTQQVVIGQDAVVADLASNGFSGVEPGSVTMTNIVRAPGDLNVETLTVGFKDNDGKSYASIVTLAETGANDGDQQSGGARRLLQFQFDFSTLIVAGECILSMAFVPKT